MNAGAALRHLWRHDTFRRLLLIRLFTQAADGTLQIGMFTYLLYSPESQPTAWAIAGALAITLLPFTILGPFVSPWLDIWPRQRMLLISDLLRAGLAAIIGALVFAGATTGTWQVLIFILFLVALSINRFMLAGLSAALEHAVEREELMLASSLLPVLGPMGVVLGGAFAMAIRLGTGQWLSANQADGLIFFSSVVLFALAVLVITTFGRWELGPDTPGKRASVSVILAELREAAEHLSTRGPVVLALAGMGITRLLFGLLSVAVILASRNLWNIDPNDAIKDTAAWGGLSGIGFFAASPLLPLVVRRTGLRRAAFGLLLVGGVAELVMAAFPDKMALFVASIFVGVSVQAFKIVADAVVQAHVAESFKGRVFVLYDLIFNSAFILSAVVAAFLMPPTGISGPVFLGCAVTFFVVAAGFWLISGKLGPRRFEQGTELLVQPSKPHS